MSNDVSICPTCGKYLPISGGSESVSGTDILEECTCEDLTKTSDRRRYNPGGNNEYTSPSQKPPRYDLRRRHKTLDPLDRKDRSLEEKDMKVSNQDKETKLAKEIARKRIKTAGEVKHIKDMSGFNLDRQNIDGFQIQEQGMKAVADTYKHLASAFYHMVQATNTFNKCKSSQVSPDGKLGGKGYVQPIKHIRSSLSDSVNVMSELIDTFYDEVTSPFWKKHTFEDNPMVKDTLSEADKIMEKAEDTRKEDLEGGAEVDLDMLKLENNK